MFKKMMLGLVFAFSAIAVAQTPVPGPVIPAPLTPPLVPSPFPVPQPPPTPAPAPTVLPHHVHIGVRMKLREYYRAQGKGIIESIRLSNQATDEVIAGLIPDAEKLTGKSFSEATKPLAGQLGDGTILKAILDFFNSPNGKALIDALIQLLLHAFGADSGHNVIHNYVFTLALPPPVECNYYLVL